MTEFNRLMALAGLSAKEQIAEDIHFQDESMDKIGYDCDSRDDYKAFIQKLEDVQLNHPNVRVSIKSHTFSRGYAGLITFSGSAEDVASFKNDLKQIGHPLMMAA